VNSRGRVRKALNHQEADHVPFDLGGTFATGMAVHTYRGLLQHLGLGERKIEVGDKMQQLAVIDEDVLRLLKVDVRPILPNPPAGWQPSFTRDGEYEYYTDEWGIRYRKPLEGGFYFDVVEHPLQHVTTPTELNRYPWPDPDDPARYAGLRERALRLQAEIGASLIGRGFVPGIFEFSFLLRGFENFYMDLAGNPTLACALMDRVMEIKKRYRVNFLAEVGDLVDVVTTSDDLSSQHGPLISPKMYRELVKPRHREYFATIKARTKAKLFLHSCGSVVKLLPDLIEMGVDIVNPVQVSAAGMDTAKLKREFGRDLTFWGGGVDTQCVLPMGTPQQVRDEVRRRIEDLAPGGGFVFATVHNVQADVPPENFRAMWEAWLEYGRY